MDLQRAAAAAASWSRVPPSSSSLERAETRDEGLKVAVKIERRRSVQAIKKKEVERENLERERRKKEKKRQ